MRALDRLVGDGPLGQREPLICPLTRELGDELEAGSAAVIVLGESKIEEQLEKAVTRANKLIEKQVDADAEELKREIDAAAKEDAG
jgi:hypothetical protein